MTLISSSSYYDKVYVEQKATAVITTAENGNEVIATMITTLLRQ
jgi:hypothetical protein